MTWPHTFGTQYPTVALSYLDDNFNAISTSTGAAIVGFLQSGTGAIARNVQTKLREVQISGNDFATLAEAFTAASGKTLYLPAGTWNFNPSGGITTMDFILKGDGKQQTKLVVTGSGDLFQRSAYSVMEHLTVDMQGATYSGHACSFAANANDQMDIGVEITNVASGKQALLFAADGGSEFCSVGSDYFTLTTAGSGAAVKVNGTDTQAIPRKFFGTGSGGCTLFDFGGCNDFFAYGFYTNGLIFGTAATHVMLSSMRVGTAGGTVTVQGSSHYLSGISAAAFTNSSTNSVIKVQVPSWAITDSGTGNSIEIKEVGYTPTWTGGVSNPSLGNGTLNARYSRNGSLVRVTVDLTMGSTTTYGSGQWFFSLPQLDESSIVQVCGSGEANAAANTASAIFNVRVEPGAQKVSMRYVSASAVAVVGSANPGAWATNDTLRFSCAYYCA